MIIYEIKNKIVGNSYIGYSTRFNSNEKFQNSNYWGSGIYIKNAIKKHGKENFERKILLKDIIGFEELNRYEILWIKKKNSKHPNGYNLTDGGGGGNGGSGMKGKTHSKKTKTKQSISRKKYYTEHPEEIKKRHFKMMGESNPMRGKHLNKKHKEKISKKLKGRFIGDKNPMYGKIGDKNHRARPVILISPNGEEYQSTCIKSFCDVHNLNSKGIYAVLRGRRNHHKGWTGRYLTKTINKGDTKDF